MQEEPVRDRTGQPTQYSITAGWSGQHDEGRSKLCFCQLGDDLVTASQSGNSNAMCAMALLYEAGWGVPRDVEKAKQWLIKAAELDNPVAWNNLGTYYAQEGRQQKAHMCFERAKQLGLTLGQPYPPPSDDSGHMDS